jgi:flagellar hook-basal body complex protein FliE
MNTLPLQPVQFGEVATSQVGKTSETGGTGFGDVLKQSLDAVNTSKQEAGELTAGLISGQHGNIHETMIAVEKAGISFRLMTKMQQKAIQAYQDVMRIQL